MDKNRATILMVAACLSLLWPNASSTSKRCINPNKDLVLCRIVKATQNVGSWGHKKAATREVPMCGRLSVPFCGLGPVCNFALKRRSSQTQMS